MVFQFVSGAKTSFAEILDVRIEAALRTDLFQPILDAMTPLQKQIYRRLAAAGDVSSVEARKSYSEALARSNVSPGSISDALKALVANNILTKPFGSHGGYTFDDPMFREWLARLL